MVSRLTYAYELSVSKTAKGPEEITQVQFIAYSHTCYMIFAYGDWVITFLHPMHLLDTSWKKILTSVFFLKELQL